MENQSQSVWIGLVGGLGVASAVHYYRELVKAIEAKGRVPHLLIAHADMSRVLLAAREGDRAGMAEYLVGLLRRMADGGATVGAVPAVMPHMCIAELVERSPIPLVNVMEVTAREIRRRGFQRVALLGSRYVVESRMFGQLGDIEVVTPNPEEIATIHDTCFQMAGAGVGNVTQYQTLRRMAHQLTGRGAEAIVFAGTDLSLVFNPGNTDFPYVDCAQVHIEALAAL